MQNDSDAWINDSYPNRWKLFVRHRVLGATGRCLQYAQRICHFSPGQTKSCTTLFAIHPNAGNLKSKHIQSLGSSRNNAIQKQLNLTSWTGRKAHPNTVRFLILFVRICMRTMTGRCSATVTIAFYHASCIYAANKPYAICDYLHFVTNSSAMLTTLSLHYNYSLVNWQRYGNIYTLCWNFVYVHYWQSQCILCKCHIRLKDVRLECQRMCLPVARKNNSE